jgi:hypothetical protein
MELGERVYWVIGGSFLSLLSCFISSSSFLFLDGSFSYMSSSFFLFFFFFSALPCTNVGTTGIWLHECITQHGRRCLKRRDTCMRIALHFRGQHCFFERFTRYRYDMGGTRSRGYWIKTGT